MEASIPTVLISGSLSVVAALGAVALTHSFSRRRDREADWRRMKLDHYKEYVAALSGIVHHGKEDTAQRRYSDSVNSLALIAPPNVLSALYAFQDEIGANNQHRNELKYEALYSALLRSMRIDCHPESPADRSDFIFRTIDVPPPSSEK